MRTFLGILILSFWSFSAHSDSQVKSQRKLDITIGQLRDYTTNPLTLTNDVILEANSTYDSHDVPLSKDTARGYVDAYNSANRDIYCIFETKLTQDQQKAMTQNNLKRLQFKQDKEQGSWTMRNALIKQDTEGRDMFTFDLVSKTGRNTIEVACYNSVWMWRDQRREYGAINNTNLKQFLDFLEQKIGVKGLPSDSDLSKPDNVLQVTAPQSLINGVIGVL